MSEDEKFILIMVHDCFRLEDRLESYKLIVPEAERGQAWLHPKQPVEVPFFEHGVFRYFQHEQTQTMAPKLTLDQNRLCHNCFEKEVLDKLKELCNSNEEFLERYSISKEKVNECLSFLISNRAPAIDRFEIVGVQKKKHR